MNILLTNDDGVHFHGLEAVREVFEKNGHQVYVFAPAKERSATSQAMTIYDPIPLEQLSKNVFSVDGFPVDCVSLALFGKVVDVSFDLVISGINKGVNMGHDTFYSGTVGAARHAVLRNLPAIAVSSNYLSAKGDFQSMAVWLHGFIMSHLAIFEKPVLLNINIPKKRKNGLDIIKWTKLGARIYREEYKKEGENGSFTLIGKFLKHKEIPESDFVAFADGYISITPLSLDGSDYEGIEYYKRSYGTENER